MSPENSGADSIHFVVWAILEMHWSIHRVRTHVRVPSQNFAPAAVRQPFARGCQLPLGRDSA